MSACRHCHLPAEFCACALCEGCSRWVGLDSDHAPTFCSACRPLFVETIPPPVLVRNNTFMPLPARRTTWRAIA